MNNSTDIMLLHCTVGFKFRLDEKARCTVRLSFLDADICWIYGHVLLHICGDYFVTLFFNYVYQISETIHAAIGHWSKEVSIGFPYLLWYTRVVMDKYIFVPFNFLVVMLNSCCCYGI